MGQMYPSYPHKYSHFLPVTLRASDPYRTIKFIFVVQIGSLINSSLSPDLDSEKRWKETLSYYILYLLFHLNNSAVILKRHPFALQYSTQHILHWLFIITMEGMMDLKLSKCDVDLVLTR